MISVTLRAIFFYLELKTFEIKTENNEELRPLSWRICGGTTASRFPEMLRYLNDLARPLRSLGNSGSEIRLFRSERWVRPVRWVPIESGRWLRRLLLKSSSARSSNCTTVSGKVSRMLLHRTSFLMLDCLKEQMKTSNIEKKLKKINSTFKTENKPSKRL